MEHKETKTPKRITTRVVLPDYVGVTTFELTRTGAEIVLTIDATDPIKRDFGFKGVVDDNEVQDNFARRHHSKTSNRRPLALPSWPKISLSEETLVLTCSTNEINNVISFDEKVPTGFRPSRVWVDSIELIDGTAARILVGPTGDVRIVSRHPMGSKTGFKKERIYFIMSPLPQLGSLVPVLLSRTPPNVLSSAVGPYLHECLQIMAKDIDLVRSDTEQKIGDVTQNQAILFQLVMESLQKSTTQLTEMSVEIASLKKELAQLRTEHSHTSARIAHVESDIDAALCAVGDEATH